MLLTSYLKLKSELKRIRFKITLWSPMLKLPIKKNNIFSIKCALKKCNVHIKIALNYYETKSYSLRNKTNLN